ncbi:MAG: hypothetical protein WC547_07725 [Candidatus Omnitrophota bacterium]
MNKRGSALIMGLFIVLVLSILTSIFLYKQVNQNLAAVRYADDVKALWVAEGGVQDARSDLSQSSPATGQIGGGNYTVSINFIGTNDNSDYYSVVSSGTVGSVSRVIQSVVALTSTVPNASKFPYGVESTVEIDFKGSSQVYGETTPLPIPAKTRDPDYYKENSTFSFSDLFGFSTDELKELSTVYNNAWPSGEISGVNWVVAPSSNFNGNVSGSGILIIQGDLKITGTIDFDGIIYVMGELDMMGTAMVSGAVLAESAASVDTTLTGTCDVEHSTVNIQNALNLLVDESTQVVSWKELPN